MRTHIGNIILLILLPCSLAAQSAGKAALVVALSKYAPGSNWPPTNAANDIPLVVNSLVQQGFDNNNIRVLQDAAATKAGIENAIRTVLLANATAGGTLVLHFSGHGQQVQDDNGDEADGLDEAIAPYDSPKDFKSGQYQGENLIRDEQLARLLEPVRQKLGPSGNLLIVLDASYNGPGNRGRDEGRGADVIMAEPEFVVRLHPPAPGAPWETLGLAAAGHTSDEAPVTVLSAATSGFAGETSGDDGKPVGAFTYAFYKALAEAAQGSTYKALMNEIRRVMGARAPAQTPGLEGDGDAQALGGVAPPLRHFAVAEVVPGKRQTRLQGGLLQGLLTGSEMVFYPAGTTDTAAAKPVAKGTVVNAGLLTADVQLDSDVSEEKISGSRAWFHRRSFGGLKVSLAVNIPDKALSRQVRTRCQILPFVHFDEKNTDLQVLAPEPGLLELRTRAGISLYRDSVSIALAGPLTDHIRQHAQAQFFREMTMSEPSLRISFDLVPVKMTRQGGKLIEQARYPLAGRTDPSGNIRFQKDDFFKVNVVNHSNRPAHFVLLYIQPDDRIMVSPDAADRQKRPGDFYLQPGESREFSYPLRVIVSEGVCALKLVASETPLDLDEVLAGKGKLLRSENSRKWNDMEHFFAESFQNVANLPPLPPGTAHISTIIFHVGNE